MNKDGDVLIARNKSQLAKPLVSDSDIIEHFKDLKNIADAFIYAKSLIEQFIEPDYFDDGRIWISADIVYRKAPNLIIYEDDFLTLHTKNYVDENYKIIKTERITENDIKTIFKVISLDVKKKFKISTIKNFFVKIPERAKEKILKYIKDLCNNHMNMTIQDYILKHLNNYYSDNRVAELVTRFFKKFSLRDEQTMKRYSDLPVIDIEMKIRDALKYFVFIEEIALQAIYYFLYEISKSFSTSDEMKLDNIVKNIENNLHKLEEKDLSETEIMRLKHNLTSIIEFLKEIPKNQKIFAEGIVVETKGGIYKVTGLFQYLNRLHFILEKQ
jgi:hypothetical protein